MSIEAPFTDDQLDSLNSYQLFGAMHPFTCPDRGDDRHGDNESRLVALPGGWQCMFCDYRQNWAHTFMGDWSWRNPHPYMIATLLGNDRVRR